MSAFASVSFPNLAANSSDLASLVLPPASKFRANTVASSFYSGGIPALNRALEDCLGYRRGPQQFMNPYEAMALLMNAPREWIKIPAILQLRCFLTVMTLLGRGTSFDCFDFPFAPNPDAAMALLRNLVDRGWVSQSCRVDETIIASYETDFRLLALQTLILKYPPLTKDASTNRGVLPSEVSTIRSDLEHLEGLIGETAKKNLLARLPS